MKMKIDKWFQNNLWVGMLVTGCVITITCVLHII